MRAVTDHAAEAQSLLMTTGETFDTSENQVEKLGRCWNQFKVWLLSDQVFGQVDGDRNENLQDLTVLDYQTDGQTDVKLPEMHFCSSHVNNCFLLFMLTLQGALLGYNHYLTGDKLFLVALSFITLGLFVTHIKSNHAERSAFLALYNIVLLYFYEAPSDLVYIILSKVPVLLSILFYEI